MTPGDTPPGRVLVVDDHPHLCWVLHKLLSERHHTVVTFQNGAAALAALATFDCQVAVVDYRLPDCDGCSLIRQMTDRAPRLRSILMSSYGGSALAGSLEPGRVFAYLDKPFKNSAIVHAVEGALAAWQKGVDSLSRESAPRNGLPLSVKPA